MLAGENRRLRVSGGIMKRRLTVGLETGKLSIIEDLEITGPKNGEVLLKLVATEVSHADPYKLSGKDIEGLFPAITEHLGAPQREPLRFLDLTSTVFLNQRHRP
jgi:hypothetical protein